MSTVIDDNKKRNIQLYIHIPFCQEKCAYCDFLSFSSCGKGQKDYVDALIKEIEMYSDYAKTVEVSTIFVGGGTPSVLNGAMMEAIFTKVREVFRINKDAEISIECNPGTVTMEKLKCYKSCGINRISLGLQATNDDELKNLGRIHTYDTFLTTYRLVRDMGIENVNVDLMSAIPGQSVESWKSTLDKIIDLIPEHISAYSLIIEEGTKFWDVYGEDMPGEGELPSEEDERAMYYATKEKLAAAGYERYEVSNYAKSGHECRHNLGYWDRVEYLGLGLGASSLLLEGTEQIRQSNEENMEKYIALIGGGEKPIGTTEVIPISMQMEEFIFLGLRKMDGISLVKFYHTFNVPIEEIYKDVLDDLYEKELLIKIDENIRFTEKGIDVSNMVLSEFLL